jgi:hypothetical protein
VWITFIVVTVIYAALGTTTILVLRSLSRRTRAADELDDRDVPYGPATPPEPGPARPAEEVPVS